MSDIRSWSPTLISKPGNGGGRLVVCRACGTAICATDQSWKEHVVLDEKPLAQSGAVFSTVGPDVLIRRFFCTSCGTTLDCEVALSGEPFLVDRIVE